MSPRNAGNTFSTSDTNYLYRRYISLMASFHAFSVELDAKYFPVTQEKLWNQRSEAVASAVRALLDAQHLAKRKKNEENLFDV